MMVNAWPRNSSLTNGATRTIRKAPNSSMKKKSAEFDRKLPSSSIREYLDRNRMLKKNEKLRVPKNRKVVINRQYWC